MLAENDGSDDDDDDNDEDDEFDDLMVSRLSYRWRPKNQLPGSLDYRLVLVIILTAMPQE